jgi:tetratricopeptide (TPR) repeat protein
MSGLHDVATPHLARGRALAGQQPETLARIGGVLLFLQRSGEALDVFAQALRLEPGLFDAVYGRGVALLRLARVEEAEIALRAAVALAPQHGPALLDLAAALIRQGRWPEALGMAEAAQAQMPSVPEAAAMLAYARQGLATALASQAVSLSSQ